MAKTWKDFSKTESQLDRSDIMTPQLKEFNLNFKFKYSVAMLNVYVQ